MHKLYLALFFISIFLCSVFVSQNSYADSSNVVISQVQTGSLVADGSAYEELIEIFNNSDNDVEVTNLCLKYGGPEITSKTLACINDNISENGLHTFLPKRSVAVFVTQIFSDKNPSFGYDKIMSRGLADNDRWISLINGTTVLDTVEWGTNTNSTTAEGGMAAKLPIEGQLLQRKMITPDILQDTNNNFDDFESALPRTIYSYGSLYDIQDLCLNIDGIQETLPEGNKVDNTGKCLPIIIDVCKNIEGDQLTIPTNYLLDDENNCIVDVCLNLGGLQVILPNKYKLIDDKCMLDLLPLKITELLPDAEGNDIGGEFIEIHNPNNEVINLSFYLLLIGKENPKSYKFPENSFIEPNSSMVFYNNEISFILVNTSSQISIMSTDGTLIDKSSEYNDPKEGESWALIDNIWQYTNQPTPGEMNLPSITDILNKIVTATSILKPCKDGQYRSEETNRCRNIITDVADLVPCAEGQERNSATNRCRSITATLGDNDLKPCDPGQERNPDTNRCRNVVAEIPKADYTPEQTDNPSNNNMTWWIVSGIGILAIGYGVWEWRQDLIKLFKKIISFIRHNK